MLEYLVTNYWSWSSTAIALFFFVFLSACNKFCQKNSQSDSLPGSNVSRIGNYYCILRGAYVKSKARSTIKISGYLELLYGACLMYDKERIFCGYLFMTPIICFYKPETVEVIMSSTSIIDKAFIYKFLDPWIGMGLLKSGGNKWRQRRKMLTPAFHFRVLEDFIPIFYEQSNVLVSKLRDLQNHSWVDIVPLITMCTLDIICETAMGVSIKAQTGEYKEYVHAIDKVVDMCMFRMLRPWLYPDFIFNRLRMGKEFSKNLKIIQGLTRKVIKEKKEIMILEKKKSDEKNEDESFIKTRRKKAFLELMLQHHFKDPTFTEEDIREEVDTFMFEGHDTTAMALCWALYLVGLDVKVQRRIHQELDEIFEGDSNREITKDDLTRMKYLECVIKESLRLYPSVPAFGREAKEDFYVSNYKIKRGSLCLILPYVLHRDQKSFPNPEAFDPERFFPENIAKRHPFAYIPFSAGPRNCIGQKFAIIEEKIILGNIFRNFTVTSKEPRDKVNVSVIIVIRNIEPLEMHFTPRNKR